MPPLGGIRPCPFTACWMRVARSCSSLVHYRVIPERCTMCGLCKEVCPQGAIVGEEYLPYLADNEPYYININKCDNCGLCLPVCEANAIELI